MLFLSPSKIDYTLKLTEFIGIIVSIFGGYLAFCEYSRANHSERVHSVVELLNRFNDGSVSMSWRKINDVWYEKAEALSEAISLDKSVPGTRARFVKETIASSALSSDIEVVIAFFNSIEVCIQNKLCDEKTAIEFFGRDARTFLVIHYPYIDENKADNNDLFADNLEKFRRRIGQYNKANKKNL